MKENYSNYDSWDSMMTDALTYLQDIMIREIGIVDKEGTLYVEFQVWAYDPQQLEEVQLHYFIRA